MKLEVINLTKDYGKKLALDNLNFTFESGIYGLLGPNGAGKSTFMNLLTDNIKITKGEIKWDDVDTKSLGKKYRKLIGYMPQQQGFYEQFSAYDFLMYIGQLKGISRKELKEEIEFWLKKVNLYEVRKRKLGAFSGGMRQRVLLAQALLGNPKIIILDEPTAGLDPKERINMRNIIAEISADKIVIIATHIVSDIDIIADQVLLLKDGKCIEAGTIDELTNAVRNQIGERECNKSELLLLQKKYGNGTVIKRHDKYYFRKVFKELPKEFSVNDETPTLEDVYLYYFET